MSSIHTHRNGRDPDIFDSPTFEQDFLIHVDEVIGSASISPSGRDVVLASQQGLHIIDLDSPFSPPRHLRHQTPWTPADVQWSPFAARYYWVVSTSNQRALVWNLEMSTSQAPIEHTLHAHSRAITDINFSPFQPDLLATCAVDAFVHCWDLRTPSRPVVSFSDWFAGATQVKWNKQDPHIIASSHDRFLRIWDDRKGALPLKTVEAHETKIYGIDWSRSDATKITTCSLDRTIKLWDYEMSEKEPERTIHTPFPVWRARHTPFGSGVLAMPQRGNNDLHLYDRRPDHAIPGTGFTDVEPNYSFSGHHEQVKEFLWRARGNIDDGVDNRDFQLISWGADRELILHRMGEKQLKAAGHRKGMRINQKWALTRRGAPYKSFRDQTLPSAATTVDGANNFNGTTSPFVQPGTSPGMSKAQIPIAGGWANGGSMMTYSGMETRNANHQDKDLISWMKGVRFGKRGTNQPERRKSRRFSIITDLRAIGVESLPENLSDEIIYVGDKFTKVKFEEVDVGARYVKVSLNGPWTPDGKLAFLQLSLNFPRDYPEASLPSFQLERTSALPDEKVAKLEDALRTIATACLVHRRGCLEAVLSYLLGERDLQESTEWLTVGKDGLLDEQADSSSDDEDGLLGELVSSESQNLDPEGNMGSGILSANANVPLPRTCGGLWAPDGRLVCFFPPKEEPKSMLQHAAFAESNRFRGNRGIFEGFGRLHINSPEPRNKGKSLEDDDDSHSDDASSTSSSSSSSSSGVPDMVPSRFRPPAAWHGGSLRFQNPKTNSTDGSLPASTGFNRKVTYAKNRTIVALHSLDSLHPSKRFLASGYLIFGDGPSLCAHNAGVAARHDMELASVWEFVKLLLQDSVPVDVLQLANREDSILVLAKRVIKRKDSGLDLSFDEPKHKYKEQGSASVKWGNHPFARRWLIQRLFGHFEARADVQMLAMLSCVFAQPLSGMPENCTSSGSTMGLPLSMLCPAQSHDYFPSEEAALDFSGLRLGVTVSPGRAQAPGAFSSSTSSAFRDNESGPVTPYSVDPIQPMSISRGSIQRSNTLYSVTNSSDHRVSIPSATSSFAASVWARPFNLASSPPTRNRNSGEDLSSSTPSNSGVTWGKNTKAVYRSDSTIRNSYMAQGYAEEYDEGSSTEEDEPLTQLGPVRMNLKNQGMFDDEAHATVPYLDTAQAWKFACYREAYAHLLGVWGFVIQRTEVLKYNGLVPVTVTKAGDRDSQSTLTLSRFDAIEPPDSSLGLHVVRCCPKCSNADVHAGRGRLEVRCSRCTEKSRILPCNVCLMPVDGLYKVCLACGHVAHASCLYLLRDAFLIRGMECEAGCGCQCDTHTIMGSEELSMSLESYSPNYGTTRGEELSGALLVPGNPVMIRRGSNTVEAKRAALTNERLRQDLRQNSVGRRRSFDH